MVFWEERALAATVPKSPSLSYSAFTFGMDFPVAWLRACKGPYIQHCTGNGNSGVEKAASCVP